MPTKAIQTLAKKYDEYPDDMFKDTRMSLGEHIEELRYRMLNALKWLLVFLVLGFILDAIGGSIGNPKVGIGKPMLKVITEPVESQTRDFYYRRAMKIADEKLAKITKGEPTEIARIRQKLKDNDNNLTALTSEERESYLGAPADLRTTFKVKQLEAAFGPAKSGTPDEVSLVLQVYPAEISSLSDTGQALIESKQYLTTLSAQEAFVVYFKVQMLCGVVLACPFILYQFWAFVGAGLYPHEKRYAYLFFGPSVLLFIAGVVLCQFIVLPGAVKALLMFNEVLGFDPDIRLNEWLSLAIILPLVFGVSFQTPLVMVFLNRIGIFSAEDYLTKWRYACIIIAFFAAIITPTPDVITMLYLFVPMFGLYMVGILICHQFPGFDPSEDTESEAAEEVAV
ncbi:twin-arginine translocase subunit TatC [Gemmata sp. G18]|uniref:Sec-independent protein translocase protein TatC n=1 Tax=Gemmata palustris TaxID=2822762 RepID=A0ABS5BLD1_9BACT|nr:twin-arginine translocase subunit TatC [Gemmata palustris]MBP3954519.1 twin-arginine translocase subunit TatC [Gemmata palustris]